MHRTLERFTNHLPRCITIKGEGGRLNTIAIDEIQYVESSNHMLTFHLRQKYVLETRDVLSRLYEELEGLSPGQFIKPYKGYIVNQKAIMTIDKKGIALRCGVCIPIPRGAFRNLYDTYVTYRFANSPRPEVVR